MCGVAVMYSSSIRTGASCQPSPSIAAISPAYPMNAWINTLRSRFSRSRCSSHVSVIAHSPLLSRALVAHLDYTHLLAKLQALRAKLTGRQYCPYDGDHIEISPK